MLTETENQIVEKGTEYRKCLQRLRNKLLKRVQNIENAYIKGH